MNAEKEKLQLKHEENEFKEQIKLLRERLEHFDDPTDENSGKFGNFRRVVVKVDGPRNKKLTGLS